MNTLLPCPFCGSDDQSVLGPNCTKVSPDNPGDRAFPIVRCMGCITDVSGKDWDNSGQTAVAAWNRRAAATDMINALRNLVNEVAGFGGFGPEIKHLIGEGHWSGFAHSPLGRNFGIFATKTMRI